MAARLTLCAGVAALVLSGCAAWRPVPLPPAAVPYAPPAAWSAGGTAAPASDLDAWWRRFGDPQLDRLVQRALAANTSVAAAGAALREARAARDAAAAGLGSTVRLTAQARHSRSDGVTADKQGNAALEASWEPDVFGANRHALAAGEADLAASAAALAAARVAVAADVARAYLELRGAQARRAIAEANLASQQGTQQITAWRVQAGLLTSLEQQQAVGATEQAAAQLAALDSGAALLAHAVAVLCGQAPAAMAAELAPGPGIPQAAGELAPAPPAAALRQRPDVRAAEWQLAAARARVGQADAARYPVVRLEGSLGLSGVGTGGSGATLLRALLGSVAGNAFDSGASRARLAQQRAALEQAQAAYTAVLLAALQEVEDALAALAAEQRRAAHFRLAGAAAANAALLARQRYAGGLADYQTVLETQRALYASQDGLAQASTGAATALVRLARALGGGWQPDRPDPGRNE